MAEPECRLVGASNSSKPSPFSAAFISALRLVRIEAARCDSVDYTSVLPRVTRASAAQLRAVFDKYATVVTPKGERMMTPEDFVRNYLGLYPEPNFNKETVKLIANAADTAKDGLVSFDEFQQFESVLCSPDALYLTAFHMFDKNASESITFDEFEKVIRHIKPVIDMEFNFDSEFIRLYFGRDKKRQISYQEFCQLLHDFHEEQGIQAFAKYDRQKTGFITAADFSHIMTSVKSHLLSKLVKENIAAVAGGHVSNLVSFPWYTAFNNLLSKIEVFKRIYLTTAKGNLQLEMTQDEFLHAAQAYAQVTPLEVSILFQLADLRHPGSGLLLFEDLERIDPERLKRISYIQRFATIKAVSDVSERGVFVQFMESGYRFLLGAIGGACGATAVYPIDLVKTRMQNQRSGSYIGELMYKSSFDCFRKVIRFEGFFGLYRGLLPQLVGVAPEKAIKLTTNDLVRDKLSQQGKIALMAEIVAGGCGGASQVMFTNPLEIVKIRLQVAGEIQAGPRVNVFTIIRDLGVRNLYKGASACFLRDIPFSAIYFPVYAHMKIYTRDENGLNSPGSLFVSAFTAGVPAAGLVTPADVIKTRLQVAARAGQTTYSGIFDCYRKVMREEGWTAFWKGTGARIFRSSPQFGVTLLAYELLQRLFYVDFGGNRPTGSEVPVHKTRLDDASDNPDHVGGYRLARPTFQGIESKFGLFLPRFELTQAAK